jgi:hypothetical protein
MTEIKTFEEAIKYLHIEDYRDRIFNSNSHGELLHLLDYVVMANCWKGSPLYFRIVFEICIKFCEENWSRPESCFQHMPKLIQSLLEEVAKENQNS